MSLELVGLTRRYGRIAAVRDLSLRVAAEETVALVGPSGCGKSTLLRLVAGLERPDAGRLLLDGRDLAGVPPQRRRIGMVFQDHALFPHLNVGANVAFGLVERGWSRDARRKRVVELLERVDLPGLEGRRPHELSGGQQQRVALARALAPEPELLLLDEPLSNLDRTLREDLTRELAELLQRLPVRALHVTHDQEEAMALGDRVAVMRAGRLVQVEASERLLERPRDPWTARFLGHRDIYPAEAVRPLGMAGPALLLTDRLSRDPHGRSFEVRDVERRDLELELRLLEPEWGLTLHWRVRPRELDRPPEPGERLTLRVPDDAWWPLEEDALEGSTP